MELWKSLNTLRVSSKNKSDSKIFLNRNGNQNFEPKVNANIFKNVFSNLADGLLKKLPNPKNKYNIDSVLAFSLFLGSSGSSSGFDLDMHELSFL